MRLWRRLNGATTAARATTAADRQADHKNNQQQRCVSGPMQHQSYANPTAKTRVGQNQSITHFLASVDINGVNMPVDVNTNPTFVRNDCKTHNCIQTDWSIQAAGLCAK